MTRQTGPSLEKSFVKNVFPNTVDDNDNEEIAT